MIHSNLYHPINSKARWYYVSPSAEDWFYCLWSSKDNCFEKNYWQLLIYWHKCIVVQSMWLWTISTMETNVQKNLPGQLFIHENHVVLSLQTLSLVIVLPCWHSLSVAPSLRGVKPAATGSKTHGTWCSLQALCRGYTEWSCWVHQATAGTHVLVRLQGVEKMGRHCETVGVQCAKRLVFDLYPLWPIPCLTGPVLSVKPGRFHKSRGKSKHFH